MKLPIGEESLTIGLNSDPARPWKLCNVTEVFEGIQVVRVVEEYAKLMSVRCYSSMTRMNAVNSFSKLSLVLFLLACQCTIEIFPLKDRRGQQVEANS